MHQSMLATLYSGPHICIYTLKDWSPGQFSVSASYKNIVIANFQFLHIASKIINTLVTVVHVAGVHLHMFVLMCPSKKSS